MTPDNRLPDGVDARGLQELLGAVHDQVATALWLSAGMLFAFCAISCTAIGLRRPALVAGFLYSLTLCFVHNGHAQALGPLGCAMALTGYLWPRHNRP